MKRSTLQHVSLFLISIGLFACGRGGCTSVGQDPWVAQVNETKITVKQLQALMQLDQDNYDPNLWQDVDGALALKKQLLQSLIEQQVLVLEADRLGVKVTSDALKAAIAELEEGYGDGHLAEALTQQGIEFGEWKKSLEKKLQVEQLIDQEIYQKINIPEDEIKSYYQAHRKQFYEPDRIHCRHMVSNKKEKTEKMLALLNKGETFATIAKKFSESPDHAQGGDLGFIKMGEYPEVFNMCFQLATGQTSQIVPSEYGFHIFYVIEKKPGYFLSLADARDKIQEILVGTKGEAPLKSWLDDLFKQAKIQVHEDVLRDIVLQPSPETRPNNNGE